MFSSSANSALCCAVGCVRRDIERPIGLAAGPNRTNFVRGPPMTSGDPRGSFGPPDRVARLAGNPIAANTVRVVCTAQHIWPVRARTAQQNTELMKKKKETPTTGEETRPCAVHSVQAGRPRYDDRPNGTVETRVEEVCITGKYKIKGRTRTGAGGSNGKHSGLATIRLERYCDRRRRFLCVD